MKNLETVIRLPTVFVKVKDVTKLVPSMVLSTILTCVLIEFAPQLMPLWMQLAANSRT